jgi:rhomboid family protein
MGIYDRDYYRREGPKYLESFALRGQATKWIIICTAVVYVLQLMTREQFRGIWRPGPVTQWLLLDTQRVAAGEVWRLVTYAFVHADLGNNFWMHIVFNMWMLWLFGGYVEDIYGRWEFLTFYLTSALAGGLVFCGEYALRGQPGFCLGASGAVTATMVLCAFYHPRLTILFMFVIPTPVWVLAILYVAIDAFAFLSGSREQVAVTVHLAGAAFAALYFQTKIRILGIGTWFRDWWKTRSRPHLRVYRPRLEEHEPVPVPSGPDVDEQLEAKVDAVLEKVARQGKESLNDAERALLLRASEIYKRRRT